MGIFDFVKDAGAKIFGPSEEEQAAKAAAEAAAEGAAKAEAEAKYAALIVQFRAETSAQLMEQVKSHGFATEGLGIDFDPASGRATLTGAVTSQADREKIVLLVGNTENVAQVDDQLVVEVPAPPAVFHTVVKGDTLSKIAKAHYKDPMKYPMLFEANKPMLKDPDLIYPGQVLRIPPLG